MVERRRERGWKLFHRSKFGIPRVKIWDAAGQNLTRGPRRKRWGMKVFYNQFKMMRSDQEKGF